MAAKGNKPVELTDIPLTLEQGDSAEMSSAKVDKIKTNSLKRFFRTARPSGGTTASKSTDSTDLADNVGIKNSRSLQLRFGSFRKNEGMQQTSSDDLEASSSVEHTKLKSTPSTESRMSLQGRLSTYWNHVFKRTPKKGAAEEGSSEDNVTAPADVNQIEQNQSENL